MLIDTHQHLIFRNRFGYAWTKDIPALSRGDFTPEDYLALTAGKDIGGAIFMETGVDDADYQAEARFVADLVADPGLHLLGQIASCRPEDDDGFEAWLDECEGLSVVGFRRILHVVPDELSQAETFRHNLRRIGTRGLPFDICFLPKQLPLAVELARACDETTLILDHCGVPDIAGGGLDPWRADIDALASMPNVLCKLSGISAYCAPGTAVLDTLRPHVDHVLAAFGAERMVWGGDWPVVNLADGLPKWIDLTQDILAGMSRNEADNLSHLTAERVFGIRMR